MGNIIIPAAAVITVFVLGLLISLLGEVSKVQGQFDQFNNRFDDLKELFKSELARNLEPINQKLGNHITDTNKEIKTLRKDVNELKEIVIKDRFER